MASPSEAESKSTTQRSAELRSPTSPPPRLRDLFVLEMFWLAWLPVLLIGTFHYATGTHHHWAHDVLRRLYYVPILFAAFSRGARGGLAVAVVASLTYAPHAFFMMHHAVDPASTLNKALEIVLYNTIGLVAGVLADREAGRRLQAEQAVQEQRRMAAQLVRAGRLAALGELVAGIAHEIKNPLHTIKGTAEIVDEIIPKDAEQTAMWTLLRQEIERLETIAERFLSFARPSKPKLTDDTLSAVQARIEELLRAQLYQAPKVKLVREPLGEQLAELRLRVDRDQLAEVAVNIASNALRAMEGHGRLVLSSALRDEDGALFAALTLENDGPVIEVTDLERIFDPFFTRAGDGTGLGLAIAERIIEEHGGFIEARNTGEVRGVAFTLVLPLSDAKAEGRQA